MAFNDLVAQKIKDFEQQGIPQVFERDLDLGNPQEPKRENIVYVIVGARRCGKTYRLYQEMRRLQGQGVELDRMLYFNFEDERLRPYEPSLLADVLDTFYALYPAARGEGAYLFFDEIQEIPEWGAFLRRVVDTEKATVYVTGSSSKMLSSELKSEFRGRSLVRELFPFRNTSDIRRGAFLSRTRPSPRAMQRCSDTIWSDISSEGDSSRHLSRRPQTRFSCYRNMRRERSPWTSLNVTTSRTPVWPRCFWRGAWHLRDESCQ